MVGYVPVFSTSTTTDYFGGKFGSSTTKSFVAHRVTPSDESQFGVTLFRDVVDKYPINVIGDQTTTTTFIGETESTTMVRILIIFIIVMLIRPWKELCLEFEFEFVY